MFSEVSMRGSRTTGIEKIGGQLSGWVMGASRAGEGMGKVVINK